MPLALIFVAAVEQMEARTVVTLCSAVCGVVGEDQSMDHSPLLEVTEHFEEDRVGVVGA